MTFAILLPRDCTLRYPSFSVALTRGCWFVMTHCFQTGVETELKAHNLFLPRYKQRGRAEAGWENNPGRLLCFIPNSFPKIAKMPVTFFICRG